MNDLKAFFLFLKSYFHERLVRFGKGFERVKNVLVAILVVKRGKYSSSFLNTSFFFLVAAAMVGGPIIAENNPFVSSLDRNIATYQTTVVSYNPSEGSLGTVISAKPRDKVVEYMVLGGDTIASIGKKFGVSTDTIKWANDLKTNIIKPGQTLKVPPGTGVVHKVVSGDTVYTLAKKYKVEAQNIVNFPFNDFADLDTFALTPGQALFVPDGVIEAPSIPRQYPPGYYTGPIQAGVRGTSNFIWPTSGSISQSPTWYHMAADIQNPGAPPVIAADAGTVAFSGCFPYGYGCHIIVDHGNGFRTLYAHMSQLGVNAGQGVSQGQQLGSMGCTGRCTGTHLHFEVILNGVQQNPLSYLK